jgi:hypothetical protein
MRASPLFLTLMLLSFLSAFILPARFTDPPRGEMAGLFSPVSRPARAIAALLHRHTHDETVIDPGAPGLPRSADTIVEENLRLRQQLAALAVRYDQLAQSSNAQQVRSDILPFCKPVAVVGTDSAGGREALLIGSSSLAGLHPDDPVLYAPQGLAGRIVRAGVSGAEVRLATDPGFAVTARIVQFLPDANGSPHATPIATLQPLVEGVGKGHMIIRSTIHLEQVNQLHIRLGDFLVLQDSDWPPDAQGVFIGRITRISPQANSPLFAEIQVDPMSNLMQLREVMVMGGK